MVVKRKRHKSAVPRGSTAMRSRGYRQLVIWFEPAEFEDLHRAWHIAKRGLPEADSVRGLATFVRERIMAQVGVTLIEEGTLRTGTSVTKRRKRNAR